MKLSPLLPVYALMIFSATAFAATDIFDAIKKEEISSVIFILKNVGPERAAIADANGVTPLHIAAAKDNPFLIETLLSYGADPDAKTSNGFSPLHWAASRDCVLAANALLEAGADPNIMTDTGVTPLHWAASKNATNTIGCLLAYNGDIESRTVAGLKPLHWAVTKKADAAAHLLAYFEVSEKEDTQQDEALPFEPNADTPHNASEIAVPRPVMTPTIKKGHSFSVNLGARQELSFVWLRTLGLWFGKFEVTNAQYRRFKHNHTSMFNESVSLDENSQPVVFVTWNEAKEFCNWLTRNYSQDIPDNWIFRLPTSGEWMAAARCGTDRKYPWGDEWPPLYGNYSDLSAKKVFSDWKGIESYEDGFPATCPVAQSGTNEWGLCGVGGNVWEWCEDWYGRDRKNKVRHGGGWDFDEQSSLTVQYQGFDKPNMKYDTVGFRVIIAERQSD